MDSGTVPVSGKGKGGAVANNPNQGGDKADERGGANKGDVMHSKVDMIDHGGTSARAKAAMKEHGVDNVTYHDGGMR